MACILLPSGVDTLVERHRAPLWLFLLHKKGTFCKNSVCFPPSVCVCVSTQISSSSFLAPVWPQNSLRNPFPQLAARRVRVGGENDQAALGVVHVAGFSASALLTLRQWIPGYPRCTETFLPWKAEERSWFPPLCCRLIVKVQPSYPPKCSPRSPLWH